MLEFSVTFTVTPKDGQDQGDAEYEMATLFKEYLTRDDSPFANDYGLPWKDEMSQGGYVGPFVSEVKVKRIVRI